MRDPGWTWAARAMRACPFMLCMALAAGLAGPVRAQAPVQGPAQGGGQPYPTRPVRIIVPSTPGGAIDMNARIVGAKLQEYWGQSVVVENRPGAAMIIGTEAVAKAAPDGYTLLVAHDGAMAMNTALYKTLAYDVQRDFAPLSLMSAAPLALVVNPGTGFNNVWDLVKYAKAHPGKLNHASGGSAMMLALEFFNTLAGTQITSVSYKGAAGSLTSVMAGETQLIFADTGSATAAMKSGKVKVLGISSATKVAQFPDLPPISLTVPGYELRTWMAAFAPAATPPEIVRKLSSDIRRALEEPDVKGRFATLNMDVVASTPEELTRVIKADTARWVKLVKERHLEVVQ